jgi:hypothetical protein
VNYDWLGPITIIWRSPQISLAKYGQSLFELVLRCTVAAHLQTSEHKKTPFGVSYFIE